MCITTKNSRCKYIEWGLLLFTAALLKLFSLSPNLVEHYYSTNIYTHLSYLQRILLGWLPFSFGDVCYAIFGIFLFISFLRILFRLYQRKYTTQILFNQLSFLGKSILVVYIIFSLFWGLNYTRQGVEAQYNLKNTTYSDTELKDLLCDITEELNSTRKQLGDSNFVYPSNDSIFKMAITAYDFAKTKSPFLAHNHHSLKSSLYTPIISYLGYSGYYNPFTGEAQVNTDLPKFYMPYVTCHEMAHQLGYASESEASFVGYLVAKQSNNTLLIYSALFELFITANSELMYRDFFSGLLNIKSLNKLVRKDMRAYKSYILRSKNDFEPIVKIAYDHYLKANQQKSGINSYNELVGWVIAYRKSNLSQ